MTCASGRKSQWRALCKSQNNRIIARNKAQTTPSQQPAKRTGPPAQASSTPGTASLRAALYLEVQGLHKAIVFFLKLLAIDRLQVLTKEYIGTVPKRPVFVNLSTPPIPSEHEKTNKPSHPFQHHPARPGPVVHPGGPSPNLHPRIRACLRTNRKSNTANLPQPLRTRQRPSPLHRPRRMPTHRLAPNPAIASTHATAHARQRQRSARLQRLSRFRLERRNGQLHPALDEQRHHARSGRPSPKMHRTDRDAMPDGARASRGPEKATLDTAVR
jgi:hypothetical protein